MKEMLDSILTPLVMEERKEIMLECVASLEEMDYSAALDELHTVCSIADDNADTMMLLGRIDDIIRVAHDQVLAAHEVKVSDEATQEQRLAIVHTILGLPNYILPDQIELILQGDFDNEEILAHLVPMFERLSFDEVWPLINEVSVSFIDALKAMVQDTMMTRGHIDEYIAPVSRIRVLNRLMNTIGRDKFSMVLELSNSGMRVGHDWLELLSNSLESLDNKNAQDAAYEMVGLAFFSNLHLDSIYSTVKVSIDEYTENEMERNIMERVIDEIKRKMGKLYETA
ncbi:hypothetical protein RVBP21_3480 [Pseudomonas phage BRkr]|nr:hypothetical protein RVBP21_3480 [Pseudomonas phage BRkr]